MSRTHSLEAIVLRTVDIDEADRFCILFTRERGRLAARARGVRKLQSRLGGVLLPFRHLRVEIAESDHSRTLTGAIPALESPITAPDMHAFVRWERGVELLLALTEEDEPLPSVFALLGSFLRIVSDPVHDPLIAFELRLLVLLGLLPATHEDKRFAALPESGKLFIQACTRTSDLATLSALPFPAPEIGQFLENVLEQHLTRPLKSGDRAFNF